LGATARAHHVLESRGRFHENGQLRSVFEGTIG
jgi:hypothetical protein